MFHAFQCIGCYLLDENDALACPGRVRFFSPQCASYPRDGERVGSRPGMAGRPPHPLITPDIQPLFTPPPPTTVYAAALYPPLPLPFEIM